MRNEPGIFATTKLLRRSPFAEWTLVYYDPEKTNPDRIVRLMKAHRCPRAKALKNSYVRNPIASPGDAFAVSLKSIVSITLPKGWISKEDANGVAWIQTPKSARKTTHKIAATATDSKTHHFEVELVSRVP